jgi:transposase
MREMPERLVFVDETAVRTDLTRRYGRAPKGQRLTGSAPFGRWQTQTLIAGLTTDGLIAPWVIPGAMDRDAFDTWVETQLVPAIAPGTVIILDNLSVHRSPRAADILKAHRSWLLPLPPYSPDLNPIEMAFAKLKAHLRRIGARTFDSLITAIGTVCNLFSPDECLKYIAHAGYVAD